MHRFVLYPPLKSTMTLKPSLGVIQGHWKNRSIYSTELPIERLILTVALLYTPFLSLDFQNTATMLSVSGITQVHRNKNN